MACGPEGLVAITRGSSGLTFEFAKPGGSVVPINHTPRNVELELRPLLSPTRSKGSMIVSERR